MVIKSWTCGAKEQKQMGLAKVHFGVALLPHSSSVHEFNPEVRSLSVQGFTCSSYGFSPTFQKHPSRWTADSKLAIDVNECGWRPVSDQCTRLMPSVPGMGSGFITTLDGLKKKKMLVMMN